MIRSGISCVGQRVNLILTTSKVVFILTLFSVLKSEALNVTERTVMTRKKGGKYTFHTKRLLHSTVHHESGT